MISPTLQQWLPAAVLVALHRASHPDVVVPILRAAWRLIRRSKSEAKPVLTVLEQLAEDDREQNFLDNLGATPATAEPTQPQEKQTMQLNLANLANAMAASAAAVSSSGSAIDRLYPFAAKMIASVETIFGPGTGVQKKAAVLSAFDAMQKEITDQDYRAEFDPWLEAVIAAYNAAAALVDGKQVSAPAVEAKAETFAVKAEAVAGAVVADVREAAQTVVGLTGAQLFAQQGSAANTQGV